VTRTILLALFRVGYNNQTKVIAPNTIPMPKPFYWLFCLLILTVIYTASAQEVTIKLGNPILNLGDKFSITLQSTSNPLQEYGDFPEINGFVKAGTSNNTYTQNTDGENKTVYSFIQFYSPQKPGIYALQPFTLRANGKSIKSLGMQLSVGDGTGNMPSATDNDIRKSDLGLSDDVDNLTPQGPIFFAISSDKKRVYVGQGFTVTIALYVADNNTLELDFYNVAEQLQQITKSLKPANCWEEDFGITEIQDLPVKLKGKRYSQFKIFQATYYPINNEPVTFSPVTFKMLSNTQAFAVDETNSQNFRLYHSKPLTVEVQDLPEHPMKGLVPVGVFRLAEFVSKTRPKTGKSFIYRFSIRGEGNISSIKAPEVPPGLPFDVYRPNSIQNIYRSLGHVTGEKSFAYNIVPQEPGIYNLGDGFQWIFFNTLLNRYDTLISQTKIKVEGPSQEPSDAFGGTTDPFYADLKEKNNALSSLDRNKTLKVYTNYAIGVLFALFMILFFVNLPNKKLP